MEFDVVVFETAGIRGEKERHFDRSVVARNVQSGENDFVRQVRDGEIHKMLGTVECVINAENLSLSKR